MLKRSRATGALDVVRLGEALSRPGMDPRTWVSLAIVRGQVVDETHGVFVDVTLMPLGNEDTARVGAEYAGAGFGIYSPLHVDDEVLVAAPSGDPNEGLVVVRRLWSASDPPPAEAVQHPEDLLIHVEKDKTLRLIVEGAGTVEITTGGGDVTVASAGGKVVVDSGGGLIQLGSATLAAPADGVVHGTGIDSFTGATYFALGNASSTVLAKK